MDLIVRKISAAAHTLGGIILGVMFLSIIANIIARELGNSMIWVDEFSGYMAVWMTYLGIGYALRVKRHVRVDLLTARLPQKWQELLRFFGDIICVVFSALITWKGVYFIEASIRSGRSTTFSEVPIYLFQIILPLGLIIFGLEALMDAVTAIQKLKRGTEPKLS